MIFFELFCWDKGFSVGEISILLSIYHGLGLAAYYPFGILIDKFGRKKWLLVGLLAEGIGFLLISMSNSFNFVLLSISILSVGLSSFMAAFRPYFADIIPKESRGKMIGISDTLQLVGKTAAPTVGGFLFEIGSALPFLISGAGNTVLGIVSSLLKEKKAEIKNEDPGKPGIAQKLLPLNQVSILFYLLLIYTFFSGFSFAGLGYIRLYLVNLKQLDPLVIGTFFSLITGSFALFSVIAGGILDKTNRGVILAFLGSLCRGIFMILIFSISTPMELYLIVPIGIPFLFSSIWVRKELFRVVPVACRGRLFSFQMAISDLSSTVAPLVYGFLWGITPQLIMLSGIFVIAGGIVLLFGYNFFWSRGKEL
ncbi:MAG: MFS transporter [Theionarchaea archaeon]|nr:MFS transporter [Theionarchaea archaeon]